VPTNQRLNPSGGSSENLDRWFLTAAGLTETKDTFFSVFVPERKIRYFVGWVESGVVKIVNYMAA
jgi:hypothetical protein